MLSVLGELRFNDEPVPLERVTYMLALLACRDEWVSRDELVLLLWGDVDEAAGRQRLRQLLYRARGFPHAAGVQSDATRVRLQETCDVRLFRAAVRESRYADAVALYGGDLLSGARFPDTPELEEFFLAEREECAGAHRRAALAHALTLAPDAALAVLERALSFDPTSQELALEGLKLARSVSATRGEALFELHARALRSLDLEPEEGVLQARAALHEAAAATEVRVPASNFLFKLPVPTSAFVGRQSELLELDARLRDSQTRLVTILGPGGAGKTRLALEVAGTQGARFQSGTLFAALAATERLDDVPSVLLGLLGVQPGDDPRAALLGALQGKELLLVLDNLEHLSGIGALVADILERAPSVRVLATSREALGLRAEQVFELGGMPAPDTLFPLESQDAALIFSRTASRVQPEFKFALQDGATFTRICAAVSGFPLGLELAASWTRVMSLEEIATELERSLDLLEVDAPDVPERHRSFAAAFYSSFRLLSPTERAALSRMSVFRGGFTRELASSVAGCALPTLMRLVNKSVVSRRETRFFLHEMIRQYAAKELTAAEREAALEALTREVLELGEHWFEHHKTEQQIAWNHRLELEHDNIRTALDWALKHDPRTGAQIVGHLEHFWFTRGYFKEAVAWAQAYFKRAETQPRDAVRMRLLWVLVSQHKELGDYEASERALNEYTAIAEELGDEFGIAQGERFHGIILRERGNMDGSLEVLERARERFERLRNANMLGICWNEIGIVHAYNDRPEDAKRAFEQSLELKRQIGDKMGISYALGNLGNIAAMMGDEAANRILQEESLRIKRELGDAQGIANSLHTIAVSLRDAGDLEGSRAYHRESLEILLRLGRTWGIAQLLIDYAWLEADSGRFDNALKLGAAALATMRRLKSEPRASNTKTMNDIRALQPFSDAERLRLELEGERLSTEEAVMLALHHPTGAAEREAPRVSARA
jgi:predicted ATPase/DNA-binding SARP family transcriptional activator